MYHKLSCHGMKVSWLSYTAGKNMEYFLFLRFLFIFVACAGVSVFEIHSFEYILLLDELFRTQQQNKAHVFKTTTLVHFLY